MILSLIMTKDDGSFTVFYDGGNYIGRDTNTDCDDNSGETKDIKIPESDSRNSNKGNTDSNGDNVNEGESEEFGIITNTFDRPGSVTKVFEWHLKNSS
jgi:hypothetical protein